MLTFLCGMLCGFALFVLWILVLGWRAQRAQRRLLLNMPKPVEWKGGMRARIRSVDNPVAGGSMVTMFYHGQEIEIYDTADGNAIALVDGNWMTIPLALLEPVPLEEQMGRTTQLRPEG